MRKSANKAKELEEKLTLTLFLLGICIPYPIRGRGWIPVNFIAASRGKKCFLPRGKKHGHGQGRGEVFTCPFSRHNLWQGLVLSYDPHRAWLMTEKRIRRRMHSLPHYFIITNHNKKKCVLCNIKVSSYALHSLIRTFELMLEATFARLCKIKKCFLLHCARLFVPLLPFEQNMGSMPK